MCWEARLQLAQVLDQLLSDEELGPTFAAWRQLSATSPSFVPFPDRLDERLRDALGRRGITNLYSHQAEAAEGSLKGANVAIVTPTASGKTLCYNLPVLQTILQDPEARALYLFPTKA